MLFKRSLDYLIQIIGSRQLTISKKLYIDLHEDMKNRLNIMLIVKGLMFYYIY